MENNVFFPHARRPVVHVESSMPSSLYFGYCPTDNECRSEIWEAHLYLPKERNIVQEYTETVSSTPSALLKSSLTSIVDREIETSRHISNNRKCRRQHWPPSPPSPSTAGAICISHPHPTRPSSLSHKPPGLLHSFPRSQSWAHHHQKHRSPGSGNVTNAADRTRSQSQDAASTTAITSARATTLSHVPSGVVA